MVGRGRRFRERIRYEHEVMECWLITRYEDCLRVLRDHETFARDPRRLGTRSRTRT
ncbi:hypothetical protein [Streptomyces sp. NBC_00887]|uniref:hypothetical protein n=1 Tax=Streptomyces sp. NBC_00887 TaxID=2975859 RepID=UPI00386BA135|nr:hypothetical protein OG844_00545 [Streptomyces sp. NBC_00887]WSY36316.1 hypothetical protein OG844_45050 [Streptomyces sp. NBC_00887]